MTQPARPFVKICGLSRLSDLRVAEAHGAAYVGLIVEVERSPRCVTRQQARLLAQAARARAVLVTTCTAADEVLELARFVQPSVVQLHGQETGRIRALRDSLGDVELWQVVGVEVGLSPDMGPPAARIHAAREAGADKIVVDAARAGQSGGTGTPMDWQAAAQLVEVARPIPTVLAGGLDPTNVSEAIRQVRPAGVDVSSGVETAPNTKSPRLIREFLQAVRQVTEDR